MNFFHTFAKQPETKPNSEFVVSREKEEETRDRSNF